MPIKTLLHNSVAAWGVMAVSAVITFATDFDWKSRLGNALITLLGAIAMLMLRDIHKAITNHFAMQQKRATQHDALWQWFTDNVLKRHSRERNTE